MKATIEELTVNRRYYCTYDKEDQDTFWGLYIASMALPSKKLNNTLIVMKHVIRGDCNNSYYSDTLDNSDTLNYIHYMSLNSIQTLSDLTYNQLMLPDDIIHYIALFV